MHPLRRILCAALCAGLLAGVLAAVAHQIGTVPLIRQAEIYQSAAPYPAIHDHAAASDWEPEDGIERTAYTLVADLFAGIGFSLLLAAGFALRGGNVTWHDGLLWGLAGFTTFTLAPGLGLPPEIPGSAAAPLAARQLWWVATALCTGAGLALIAFTRRAHWAILAAALIALPHLYGAPPPAGHAMAAPATLAREFAAVATAVSFLFWSALGAAAGYFYTRFGDRSP